MDKTTRNKILARIKGLYKAYRKIEYFRREITRLEEWLEQNRREQIELKGLNIDAYSNMGIDYSSERVTTSPTGSSMAERETQDYVRKLEQEELLILKQIRKKDRRIRKTQQEFGALEYNLELLSPQCKQLIELLCKENRDFNFVTREMFGGSRTSTYGRLDATLQAIQDWEGWSI